MANEPKLDGQKPAVTESTSTDESKAKFFTKSDHPKTVKESIKLALNLFLNLLFG